MAKFQLNIGGSNYEVDAESESDLPEIAETIAKQSQQPEEQKQPEQPQQVNPFISALQTVGKSLPTPSQPIEPVSQINRMASIAGEEIGGAANRAMGLPEKGIPGFISKTLTNPYTYATMAASRGVPKEIGEGISSAMSKAPSLDKPMMDRATTVYNAADDAIKNINKDYAIFRDAVKDTPVNQASLQKSIDNLYGGLKTGTQKSIEKMEMPGELNDDLTTIFKEGPNLKSVFDAKDAVKKHIKDRTWVDFKMGRQVTPEQEHLIKSYFSLDKIIDDSLEGGGLKEEKQMLDYMNQRATDVHKLARQAKDMVTKKGSVLRDPTKLIEAFTNVEKGIGQRNVLNQLSELEPQVADVVGKMNKYRSSKVMKKALERFGLMGEGAGMAGAGLGLAQHLLRR